ncbi:uncharacterized protein LOC144866868 [Branchiostoma floridae x Branchiostoma japonicum]
MANCKVVLKDKKTNNPKMWEGFSALGRHGGEAQGFGVKNCVVPLPVGDEVDHEEVILTSVKQEPYDSCLGSSEVSSEVTPVSQQSCDHSREGAATAVTEEIREPVFERDKFASNNQKRNSPKLQMPGGKGQINQRIERRDLFSITARLSNKATGRRKGKVSRSELVTPINPEALDVPLQGPHIIPVGQETQPPQGDHTVMGSASSMSDPASSDHNPNFVWQAENNMSTQTGKNGSATTNGPTVQENASGSSTWVNILPPASSQSQGSENEGNAIRTQRGQTGIHQFDEQGTQVAGFPYMSVMQVPPQTIADRAANLQVGDSFSTWDELQAVLDEFQRLNKVKLSKTFCTTVEAKNKKLSDFVQKFPSAHVYSNIQFGCIHSGKRRSRSTGIRANQWSIKMECPARIYVTSDRAKQKLVIKAFNNDHNHEMNKEIKKVPSPPKSRETKYKEVLEITTEIAEVTSLCGDEEFKRRLEQMRYLLNCWKSNKAVQIKCTSHDGKACTSGSQRRQGLPVDQVEGTEAVNHLSATQHVHIGSCAPSEDNKGSWVGTTGGKRRAENKTTDKLPQRKKPKAADRTDSLWMSQA